MKFIKLWVPVFVWAGLIYIISDIPQLSTGWGIYDLILRKIAHVTEYFILVWLLYRALKDTFPKLIPIYLFAISFTLSFIYAVTDEIHQFYVLGRSCSKMDLAFDTLGIVIFFIILKLRKPKGAHNVD